MSKITKVIIEGDFKSTTRNLIEEFLLAKLELTIQKYEIKTYPKEPHTLYIIREDYNDDN